MPTLARLGATAAVIATMGSATGCGPSLPSTPEAYVVSDVGPLPARSSGADVDAYREVFGDTAIVYAVGSPDPASGLPPAIVAVVPIGGGLSEGDVLGRAFGPGDEVTEGEMAIAGRPGIRVRSASSRQGEITLQVRLWRPTGDLAVVVVGTGPPEAADAVMEAVAAHVG